MKKKHPLFSEIFVGKKKRKINWLPILIIWIIAVFGLNTVLFCIYRNAKLVNNINNNRKVIKKVGHIPKPKEVKGIYITANTAGVSQFNELVNFVKKNGLNTVVVDIKGHKGQPAFIFEKESLKKYNVSKPVYDVNKIIKKLHDNNIYTIARLFVFQDPYMVEKEPQFALHRKSGGLWRDYKGVKWLDPTHFGVWKYNMDIAREAYERGFDEIQLDYIRFPSDGNLATIKYTNWNGKTKKEEEMEKFFKYVSQVMRAAKIPISADLFGLVCCYDNYDLGIGQSLERALPYFDFISPMMYPSHYENGFIGLLNPAAHPYAVVKYSMQEAMKKRKQMMASSTTPLAEIRPWIQDFDIGANYDAVKVRAQIHATFETGGEGFLIWNARNVYTTISNQ